MNETTSPPPLPSGHSWRGRRITALFGIALFFVLCLFFAAAFVLFKLSSYERQIAEAQAGLAAEGFPTTLVELDASYRPLPEAENGAVSYLKVIETMEAIDRAGDRSSDLADTLDSYDRVANYPPDVAEALRALCEDASPVFDGLTEAAGRSKSRYPIDLTLGMATELPHLGRLRHLARFLKMATTGALVEGDLNVAIGRHTQILAVAATLREEPLLISQLVRVAMDGIASESLEVVLSNAELDDGQLADLSQTYDAAVFPESYRRAIGSEWCVSTGTIHGLLDGTIDPEGQQAIEGMAQLRYAPKFVVKLLFGREVTRLHAEFAAILPEEAPHWPDIAARSAEADSEAYAGSILAAILLPSMNRSGLAFVRDVAFLRMPQAAIAVERYRLAHGALPDSLADCVPEFIDAVPDDPYDGAPLRYRQHGEGYIIYSVFEDLDDDDGTPYVRGEARNREGDLVFTVTR